MVLSSICLTAKISSPPTRTNRRQEAVTVEETADLENLEMFSLWQHLSRCPRLRVYTLQQNTHKHTHAQKPAVFANYDRHLDRARLLSATVCLRLLKKFNQINILINLNAMAIEYSEWHKQTFMFPPTLPSGSLLQLREAQADPCTLNSGRRVWKKDRGILSSWLCHLS